VRCRSIFLEAFWCAVLLQLCVGCGTVTPVPTPTPSDDAALSDSPLDPFAGRIFDCSGMDTSKLQSYANTCGDSLNTGTCLIGYANTGIPTVNLACAARDAEVAAFVEVDRGTASPFIQARAAALRLWIKVENFTLRGSP
jgi:hypothetical protein